MGYSPEEWDALQWWQQRLMLDGLEEEFKDPDEDDETDERTFQTSDASEAGFTVNTL